jgi:hypothetical protein
MTIAPLLQMMIALCETDISVLDALVSFRVFFNTIWKIVSICQARLAFHE